jgi:hypothetical protein
MFYELSKNQAWINERVNLFVALAPIANMKNSVALKPIVDVMNELWKLLNTAHIWEIFSPKIKD